MTEVLIPNYLNEKSFDNEAVGTIVREATIAEIVAAMGTKRVLQIPVKIGDTEFIWTVNKSSQKRLADAWGRETANWEGHKVRFTKAKQQAFGKEVTVISGYPVAVSP